MIIQQSRRGNVIVFSAWEKNDNRQFSCTTPINGEIYGLVSSEFTPREMLSYFNGYEAAKPLHEAWRRQSEERAYRLIIEQYPHAASGKREKGWIYYKTGR